MSNLFLSSGAADAAVTGGSGTKWKATQTAGASARTIVKKCANPNTLPAQMTDGAGTNDGTVVSWYSDPLAAVTITGTITCSLWTFEGAVAVNASVAIQVERVNGSGTFQSTICANSVNGGAGECPTTAGSYTQTLPAASVVDTAMSAGDRIRVTAWLENASDQGGSGSLTTATTRYAQMYINGPTGSSGQSQLAFTESLAFIVPKALTDSGIGSHVLGIAMTKSLADSGSGTDKSFVGATAGLISGTATGASQAYSFTIQVTDSAGTVVTKALSITTTGGGTAEPLTESGAGADTLGIMPALAESGASAEAVFIPAFADQGTSAEALALAQPTPLAETGTGTVLAFVPAFADTGASTESLVASQPTPLTESGAGADLVFVPAFADTGTSSEAFSLTQPTGLADSGQGTDLIYIPAFADAGSSSDTIDTGVGALTVPLTDSGAGADFLGPVTALTEAGAGTDSTAQVAATALADSGTGADTLAAAATSLSDSGTGTDALAIPGFSETGTSDEFFNTGSGQEATLTENGSGDDLLFIPAFAELSTGTDVLVIILSVPLADSGTGASSLSVPGFAETGSGTDALSPGALLADSGTGTVVFGTQTAAPYDFTETGHADEFLFVPGFAESGTGLDTLGITATIAFPEQGQGTDVLSLAYTAGLTESGAGAVMLGVIPGLGDTGTSSETLATVQGMALADAGAALEALGIASLISLPESGAGSDGWAIGYPADFTESGAGTDSAGIMPGLEDTGVSAELLAMRIYTGFPGMVTVVNEPVFSVSISRESSSVTVSRKSCSVMIRNEL
jgi:stage V sporulation protein SpoVS